MSNLSSLEASIDGGFGTFRSAAAVGSSLVSALEAETSELDMTRLVLKFRHAVEDAGYELSLLPNRIDYATRLALSSGQLLYEEMHKLFHLCEEVVALQALGYEASREVVDSYVAAVSARFRSENGVASMVAEDLGLTRDSDLWQRSGIAGPGRADP